MFLLKLLLVHSIDHPMGSENVVTTHVVLEATRSSTRGIVTSIAIVTKRIGLIECDPRFYFVSEVFE